MKAERRTDHASVVDVPEAVGVFDSFDALQAAFYDLRLMGVPASDISVLAGAAAVKEKLGRAYWTARELEDDPRAPRVTFVSEEAIGELEGAIAGGFLFLGSVIAMTALLTPASTAAASIAALVIGGSPGAVIGGLLAGRVERRHRDYYSAQVAHGGILLWVRVPDEERRRLVVHLLEGHSGRDVHVHDWSE